jgi:hypothetical protein
VISRSECRTLGAVEEIAMNTQKDDFEIARQSAHVKPLVTLRVCLPVVHFELWNFISCGAMKLSFCSLLLQWLGTPLWVTIGAVRMIGVIVGVSGLLLLFDPWTFDWDDHRGIIRNALILAAALCWAASILHVRAWTRFTAPDYTDLWGAAKAASMSATATGLMMPVAAATWTVECAPCVIASRYGRLAKAKLDLATARAAHRLPNQSTNSFSLA